jgi:uncharacterized membrane protein
MRTARALGRLHDERGFVTAFIVRMAVVLVLLGLVVVDGGAVIFARLQAQDVAETAAAVAAGAYKDSRDKRIAIRAAETAVADKDADARLIRRGVVFRQDGTVEVQVRKRAPTIMVQRFGFLEHLHVATGSAVGEPPLA